MKVRDQLLTMICVCLACVVAPAAGQDKPKLDDPRIDRAKQFFEQFVKLENDFDPALADLYSGKAKILNSVRYDDGMTRVWGAPTPYYKEKIKKDLAAAKEEGGRNTYTNTEFTAEGKNVRIKTTCYSALDAATNPVTFLVGPDDSGQWLILEETTQTKGKGSHGLPLSPPPPALPGK